MLLFIILSLGINSNILAQKFWHHELTNKKKAQNLLNSVEHRKKIPYGIFDISFYKIESILEHILSPNYFITDHDLYSPHGVAVASLISHPMYGGTSQGLLSVMNTGIYSEDFKRGVELAIKHNIKLINVSLSLRTPEIADIINEAYEEHGIIFVVSSGNNADIQGRDLPDYYLSLNAIIASCVDQDYTIPDFAKIDTSVTVLAPCDRNNIPTVIFDKHRGIQENYLFGMTSSAAPQVSAAIIDYLSLCPESSLHEIKKDLHSNQLLIWNNQSYPILDHHDFIKKAFKKCS